MGTINFPSVHIDISSFSSAAGFYSLFKGRPVLMYLSYLLLSVWRGYRYIQQKMHCLIWFPTPAHIPYSSVIWIRKCFCVVGAAHDVRGFQCYIPGTAIYTDRNQKQPSCSNMCREQFLLHIYFYAASGKVCKVKSFVNTWYFIHPYFYKLEFSRNNKFLLSGNMHLSI